jgi:hypothetical protein
MIPFTGTGRGKKLVEFGLILDTPNHVPHNDAAILGEKFYIN